MTRERLCWDCQHVYWKPASPGYSDLTPGSSLDISCNKHHWALDAYGDTLADFRRYLLMAGTCPDFEPRQG